MVFKHVHGLIIEFFYYSESLGTSPTESQISNSYGSSYGSYGSIPSSLPTFQHPSHSLLKENGFTQQGYHKYRSRCLKGKVKFY